MARNNTQDAFRTAKEQRVESVHKEGNNYKYRAS